MENNCAAWQNKILYESLKYNFIKEEEVDEAIKILSKYNSEDDFFCDCCDAKGLAYMLALASQI
jgi:hypothetical protein